jgi:SAM-dependent methyltransferase
MDQQRSANLANWDERVDGHLGPDGYSVDRLVDDPDWVTAVVAFDAPTVGDVTGRSLLHSQCHIGTDTLSWAKLGATVTGLDFSPKAIAAATDIAGRLGDRITPATFVQTELYDAPNHIDETFDIVYTGVGAICWLPDIVGWAEVMARFVRPGGTFYIRDSHPAMLAIDEERDDELLVMKYPYFHTDEALHFAEAESYAGSATLNNVDTYEWAHSISEVTNALIGAGFVINRLDEHRHLDWQFTRYMQKGDGDYWVMPDHLRDLLPLQFSILASKPG